MSQSTSLNWSGRRIFWFQSTSSAPCLWTQKLILAPVSDAIFSFPRNTHNDSNGNAFWWRRLSRSTFQISCLSFRPSGNSFVTVVLMIHMSPDHLGAHPHIQTLVERLNHSSWRLYSLRYPSVYTCLVCGVVVSVWLSQFPLNSRRWSLVTHSMLGPFNSYFVE